MPNEHDAGRLVPVRQDLPNGDGGEMSRTKRHNYLGEPIRDGAHGKKCPEANCNVCGTGYMKRVLRRLVRRARKDVKDD